MNVQMLIGRDELVKRYDGKGIARGKLEILTLIFIRIRGRTMET